MVELIVVYIIGFASGAAILAATIIYFTLGVPPEENKDG